MNSHRAGELGGYSKLLRSDRLCARCEVVPFPTDPLREGNCREGNNDTKKTREGDNCSGSQQASCLLKTQATIVLFPSRTRTSKMVRCEY